MLSVKISCWTTSGAKQSLTRSCLFIVLCLGIQSCDKTNEPLAQTRKQHVINGSTMGTQYSVKIIDSSAEFDAKRIKSDVDTMLEDINQVMSTYIESSELSLLNQASHGQYHAVSTELFSVITEAILISNVTDGSFDITVGPLINLWGFGTDKEHEHIPTAQDIENAQYQMGFHHIILMDDLTIRKNRAGMYIDLSAIAKGYAVDRVAEWLEAKGMNDYMVEIGGEIKVSGKNQQDDDWQIGIEQPRPDGRALHRIVALRDAAMATSGSYRNYFERDGIRYSHIINPVTGKPITHKMASISVIHTSTATADALATALFVMGPENAMNLAISNNLAILMLVKNDNSDGFHEMSSPLFDAMQ